MSTTHKRMTLNQMILTISALTMYTCHAATDSGTLPEKGRAANHHDEEKKDYGEGDVYNYHNPTSNGDASASDSVSEELSRDSSEEKAYEAFCHTIGIKSKRQKKKEKELRLIVEKFEAEEEKVKAIQEASKKNALKYGTDAMKTILNELSEEHGIRCRPRVMVPPSTAGFHVPMEENPKQWLDLTMEKGKFMLDATSNLLRKELDDILTPFGFQVTMIKPHCILEICDATQDRPTTAKLQVLFEFTTTNHPNWMSTHMGLTASESYVGCKTMEYELGVEAGLFPHCPAAYVQDPRKRIKLEFVRFNNSQREIFFGVTFYPENDDLTVQNANKEKMKTKKVDLKRLDIRVKTQGDVHAMYEKTMQTLLKTMNKIPSNDYYNELREHINEHVKNVTELQTNAKAYLNDLTKERDSTQKEIERLNKALDSKERRKEQIVYTKNVYNKARQCYRWGLGGNHVILANLRSLDLQARKTRQTFKDLSMLSTGVIVLHVDGTTSKTITIYSHNGTAMQEAKYDLGEYESKIKSEPLPVLAGNRGEFTIKEKVNRKTLSKTTFSFTLLPDDEANNKINMGTMRFFIMGDLTRQGLKGDDLPKWDKNPFRAPAL